MGQNSGKIVLSSKTFFIVSMVAAIGCLLALIAGFGTSNVILAAAAAGMQTAILLLAIAIRGFEIL